MANIQIPNSGTITITGSVNTSGTGLSVGSKTITLNTRDTYVYENIDVNVNATVDVQSGSLSNTASPNVTYSPNTDQSTVLPAQGTLYINEGWYPATSITLGHMIPDIATNDAGDNHILYGYKAYDEDGNLITGTLATVVPTFKGGAITVTPSVTNLTVPTATISSTGTFKSSTNYGVTTTQPSGTDGTAYLTIDGTISKTDGSVKASADATRAAVLYDTNTTGNIAQNTNDVALAAQTTPTSGTTATATTITPTITDNFEPLYIPIVTPNGEGGEVTKTSGSGSISGTAPTVTLGETGTFLPTGTGNTGANYGVTTTKPSGTDGTSYLTITPTGSTTTKGSYSGTATIDYLRASVTPDGNYQGAVNMSDSDVFLASGTGSFAHTLTPLSNIDATIAANPTSYYIPVVTPKGNGGELTVTGGSISSLSGTAPNVAVSASGSFTTSGTTYGITTQQPGSGTDGTNYLTLNYDGTPGSAQSYTADITLNYNRAAVNANNTYKGVVSMTTSTELLAAAPNQSASQANVNVGSIQATKTGGGNYYVPIVSVPATSSVTNAVTDPTVDTDSVAAYGGTGQTGTPAGFKTSNSGMTNYITITPSASATGGTVTSTVSNITINKGITAGGTITGGTDTDAIGISAGTTTLHYIEVYDGTYTVA